MKRITAAVTVSLVLGLTLSACGSTAADTSPAPTRAPVDRSAGGSVG